MNAIGDYLKQTCCTAPLSDEETRRLIRQTREGVESERLAARNQLIEANMRLVASRAKRFLYAGIPYRDLMQVGVLGAIRSIELYDAQKAKLSTYMAIWIDAAIQHYIDESISTIRQPAQRRRDYMTIRRAHQRLTQELGQRPTAEELEEETGITREDIIALCNTYTTSSLDASAGVGPDIVDRGALIGDEDVDVEAEAAVADLWRAVGERVLMLSEISDERIPRIIVDHYIVGRSCEEIAEDMGVSRQRVQQIKSRALALLRWLCADDDLKATWQAHDCRLHKPVPNFVIGVGLGTEGHRR